MKFWNEVQIFFVYDTKHCLREEDDPKEAIIYFHPPDTADNVRCGLCCQLMGMAQFCSSTFSKATFMRLLRNKFALKSLGRYVLGLGGNSSMPDSVLRRQLNALYDVFQFYHNNIDEVHRTSSVSADLMFEDKMNEIWNFFLPVSQHFGNTLSLTFEILPTLIIPKSAGSIFMRASQILQLCQSRSEVYAGCILSNNQVLCSQLPPSIIRHVYFISSTKPQVPAHYVTTTLPAGVTIIYVYVKRDLLENELQQSDRFKGEIDGKEEHEADTSSGNESWKDTLSLRSDSESQLNGKHGNETEADFHECVDKLREVEEETMKVCLYVQGHSNTQLVLLTSETLARNPKSVDFLWRTGLSSLVDLEMDIKNLIENQPKQERQNDYCYLQFDYIWNSIKIDEMIPMCPSDPADQLFNRTVQIMHETFVENPSVEESSLIFANSSVYGHKLSSLETYFQETLKQPTLTSLSAAVENVTKIQSSARHKLEKDHGIMIV